MSDSIYGDQPLTVILGRGAMICQQCKAEGRTSRVWEGMGAYYPSFYDEADVYHDHDYNITTANYTCSNGHAWIEDRQRGCSAPGCAFQPVTKVRSAAPSTT
jgi:hypothetical protein